MRASCTVSCCRTRWRSMRACWGCPTTTTVLSDIAGYILARKLERITNRDVQRGSKGMRSLKQRDVEGLFEQLDAFGWLTRVPGPRPSYPHHWVVNPAVHQKFAKRAEAEKKRRERTARRWRNCSGAKMRDGEVSGCRCVTCVPRAREIQKTLCPLRVQIFTYHPARARDTCDSPSRRLLQKNGCAGRRSRLKIQAGCRPHRHTLPDPNDVDALWSATAGRLVSNGVGNFCIQRNVPNRVAKSDETDLRTPELDDVVL